MKNIDIEEINERWTAWFKAEQEMPAECPWPTVKKELDYFKCSTFQGPRATLSKETKWL
jgi:hypothetical protein